MTVFSLGARLRHHALALCVFSVLAAGCGGESAPDPEPGEPAPTAATSVAPGTTATTATAPSGATTTSTSAASPATTAAETAAFEYEPTLVSYRYPTTGEVEYALSIEQTAEVILEGGPSEEMPPGPIETATTLEGSISYRTSPGVEENTTSLRITSALEVTDNRVSMGGITIPTPADDAIAGAPGLDTPIDITVVVDEQGNVLEMRSEALEGFSDLFGEEGLMSAGTPGAGQLNQPLGPTFPDDPVEIGDEWTERTEQEGPAGMGTVVTTAEHRLVAVENEGGKTVLVIESEYLTEAFEWDMSEMLAGMFEAFADELGGEEGEQSGDTPPTPTMTMSATAAVTTAVTRFDLEAGLVLEGEYRASGGVTSSMAFPDGTGETEAIVSTTTYEQTVTYRLVSPTV